MMPPVIAIDGPSASGKGTVAQRVAAALGFSHLDSGALYRLVAYAARERGVALDDEPALSDISLNLNVIFSNNAIIMDGRDVGGAIRSEEISAAASTIAVLPKVRQALLERQRAFRQPPGLVAEGRDMGTVVFPDAVLKIYLTASAEVRAERRHKQLMEKGMSASINTLLQEIRSRDTRDSERALAPLQKSAEAIELDTTDMTVEAAVTRVLDLYRKAAG
jgi:cytidylate kinase